MPSVFTRIIKGELPCYKIFEDEHTFALLARDQVTHGHTLIVPKIEVDYFVDVPEPYYSAVFVNAKRIARALQTATECRRVSTIIAGWDVPHFHYHLIPTDSIAELDFGLARVLPDSEMQELQQKIVDALT